MLIDWFTVGAQALNFAVLVWLMKRFLYKPILNAIDEREKRIAEELANADRKKAEARKESDEFRHRNEEIDRQREALLMKAEEDAKKERKRLMDDARDAAAALRLKQEEMLRNEKSSLHQAIRQLTLDEVFAVARKALADLATAGLEGQLCEAFNLRLRKIEGQAKGALSRALKASSGQATVRSAFELTAEQRSEIIKTLNDTFSTEVRADFEIRPDLISGIELILNGQKAAWSIGDYLGSLEKRVHEVLEEKDKSEPKPDNGAEEPEFSAKRQ